MTQDLMIQPEDSLLPVTPPDPTTEIKEDKEVSFTAPATWGSDMTLKPAETTPASQEIPADHKEALQPVTYPWLPNQQTSQTPFPSQETPLIPPQQPQTPQINNEEPHFNLPRTILIGFVLILCGILLGILATKYLPVYSTKPTVQLVQPPVSNPTEVITPVITSSITPTIQVAPTATPASLLNLKWNLLTVKSPLSLFKSYRLHYPTTWAVKSQKTSPAVSGGVSGSSSLVISKGTALLSILQIDGETANCVYPGSNTQELPYANYLTFREIISANGLVWRWGQVIPEEEGKFTYYVCEQKGQDLFSAATSIGVISLNDTKVESQTLEEFNYILEKIEILK